MSEYRSPLSAEELARNFSDIAPPLTAREASLESDRCLYCYDAPCIKACPTRINIPHFIRQIGTNDLAGAAKTIFTENIFGGACGRVCPTAVLCEGACVYKGMNEKPIEIGRLQRYATDHAMSRGLRFWTKGPDTGKKVAIVGGGPAGLTCAHELTKHGHSCTVYEASDRLGGLNTWGVAGYKIDTGFSTLEADYVASIGVEVVLNARVGEKPSVGDLLAQYDALFLAIGMGETATLGIPGEELDGYVEALDFIRPTREPNFAGAKVGRHVVVLGGGNTAIDVATAAARLGAEKVTIVYRRTAREMPAYRFEYELAKSDGVAFEWLTQPRRIIGDDGRVAGIECVRLALTPDASGRGRLSEIAGSEFILPCDMVVPALGQNPLEALLASVPGLERKDGCVAVDETLRTSVPKLFAGGDCVTVAEVVNAVQAGKKAASGIHSYLSS